MATKNSENKVLIILIHEASRVEPKLLRLVYPLNRNVRGLAKSRLWYSLNIQRKTGEVHKRTA